MIGIDTVQNSVAGLKSRMGRYGIWTLELRFGDPAMIPDTAAELESAGFGALWIPGGIGGDLMGDMQRLLDATTNTVIGSGILNIYRHEPDNVASWWNALSAEQRARALMGLGVSHSALIGESYGKPVATMSTYLDALDAAGLPRESRCLAALGPKMVALAGERTAGSHPYLSTPEHTARSREILGSDPILAPEQGVILESDPAVARGIARGALQNYLRLPNYLNSWRRMGFSEEEVTEVTDTLVDGLFAWGTAAQIAERLREHHSAGADHVAIQVIHRGAQTMTPPRAIWQALAEVLF